MLALSYGELWPNNEYYWHVSAILTRVLTLTLHDVNPIPNLNLITITWDLLQWNNNLRPKISTLAQTYCWHHKRSFSFFSVHFTQPYAFTICFYLHKISLSPLGRLTTPLLRPGSRIKKYCSLIIYNRNHYQSTTQPWHIHCRSCRPWVLVLVSSCLETIPWRFWSWDLGSWCSNIYH